MNDYQRVLRDFQDYADDVIRSRGTTFPDCSRRFVSALAPGTPLGDVTSGLPSVDIARWLRERTANMTSMVGSGDFGWPEEKLERLAMQLALIRKIAAGEIDMFSFMNSFFAVGSCIDEYVSQFVQYIFKPFVRDFLRFAHDNPFFEHGLRSAPPQPSIGSMPNQRDELEIFISHGSIDAPVAKLLISLYEKSLKISARKIRCTSVNGYRLPGGVDTNDTLRTEVFGTQLFIALLTPDSIKSPYVLFELGARWGARKLLVPLVARGLSASDLPAPLNGLNALSVCVPDQVCQHIEETADVLAKQLEPSGSFSAEVDALVALSRSDR
jgi:hypothetical protein